MTRTKTFAIGECLVHSWDDHRILETEFADGLSVTAAANDDPDSIARAYELGYNGDTWEMSKAHEVAHTLPDVARGYQYSRVLRGVAVRATGGSKEDVISPEASDFEEGLCLSFQRWCNLGILTPTLVQSDLDLDALKAELRSMTSG